MIDIQSGSNIAVKIDEINLNGLVTGVHIDKNGTLGFTGTDGNAFLWLFYDYQAGDFFSGNKRKIGLGFLGQNESLYLDDNQTAWITSEDTFQPGKIFFLDYADWIVSSEKNILDDNSYRIYPNPIKTTFHIEWKKNEVAIYQIKAISGVILQTGVVSQGSQEIQTKFPAGVYILTLSTENNFGRSFIVKQ